MNPRTGRIGRRRRTLCQRCLLALDVCHGVVELAADPVRSRPVWPFRKGRAVQLDYVAKRVWHFSADRVAGSDADFFLPRVSGRNPVREKLLQQAQLGGYVHAGIEAMTQESTSSVRPRLAHWHQYLTYLHDMSRLHFNYSICHYPRTVNEIMAEAIPWTVGLLGTTTILSFTIGTLLGALRAAWPRAPGVCAFLMPPLWALHAIPFFLCGLILMYLLAFQLQWLPMFGGYTAGAFPALTLAFVGDVLPARDSASAVDHSRGHGRLGPDHARHDGHNPGRGHVTFAEAKGLKSRTVFLRYCVPQQRFCPRLRPWRWPWDRSSPARSWSKMIFPTPALARCYSMRFGKTPLPHPGYCLLGDCGARPGDLAARPALSLARSAYYLQEGVNARCIGTTVSAHAAHARSGTTRRVGGWTALYASQCVPGRRHLLLLALVLFVGIGHIVVDTSKSRALSVPALRPPSLPVPLWHGSARPRLTGHDGGRDAAHPADRLHCRVPGCWHGHYPGLCLSLLSGQDRYAHSELSSISA